MNAPDARPRLSIRLRFTPHAFSLLELLVVITIIAILAVISLAVFQRVQEKGLRTKCAANLRSIGIAINVYTGTNNGMYPYSVGPGTYTLDRTLVEGGYLSGKDVLKCPDDLLARQAVGSTPKSYCLNSNIFWSTNSNFQSTTSHSQGYPARIQNPLAQLVMMFERPTPLLIYGSSDSSAQSSLATNIDPNTDHVVGCNFLFADGHVQFLDYRQGPLATAAQNTARFNSLYFPDH